MARGKLLEFIVHMKSDELYEKNVLEDPSNLWGEL